MKFPIQVTAINIPFVKRPKIVNVKRLVRYTKNSIDHQLRSGEAIFSGVYAQLARSSMGNVLSPALALYAILQNANRHRFYLSAKHHENSDVVYDVEIHKAD